MILFIRLFSLEWIIDILTLVFVAGTTEKIFESKLNLYECIMFVLQVPQRRYLRVSRVYMNVYCLCCRYHREDI